jgi:DNA-directed RNA polymerase I subunit RPA2
MPFTESGMTPDVIINPHAFPSRMTIGMLIESMAGKSGALNGNFVTSNAFSNYENDDVVKHFGDQLLKNGYNYYGNEIMYSGT